MTSNERKIIECVWKLKGKTNIKSVSNACGLSADYIRILCKSLDRAGYLKFENTNVCHLLKKGWDRFEGRTTLFSKPEPVDSASASETKANNDENQNEQNMFGDNDKDSKNPNAPVDNEELDRALAEMEIPPPKQENELSETARAGEAEKNPRQKQNQKRILRKSPKRRQRQFPKKKSASQSSKRSPLSLTAVSAQVFKGLSIGFYKEIIHALTYRFLHSVFRK